MKKITYTIDNGGTVQGYQVRTHFAVRNMLQGLTGKRDRAKCTEKGMWQLEHVPTGMVVCRGYYRADVVAIARQYPADSIEYASETDPTKLLDAWIVFCKDWIAIVVAQRKSVV